ncbi:MAG: FtsX-like permease family protein [Acidimicrobiales bacterium]
MGAAWYRARGELRRRWRATLLLVLLVGVAGGAVLTAVAGARRSSTAYDRFRDATLAGDLEVAFDGPPTEDLAAAAERIRSIPQVTALAHANYPFVVPKGSGAYPYLDFLAYASTDDAEDAQVDLPRLLRGTAPDPDAPDEMAISEIYARESGLRVGDRAEFESYSEDQLPKLFDTGDAGPPAGPELTLEVTGVFDAPTFLSDSSGDFQPRIFLTPAFLEEAAGGMAVYPGGFTVRLRGGADDAEEATAALREAFADAEHLEITPSSEVDAKIQSSIDVIVTALVLCGLVAALAGTLAIAQAMVRHYASNESSDRWLAALGMTRWERVVTKTATALPVAALGALLAVALSILASPLMPVGIARRAEPDPGLDVDRGVVLAGFLLLALGVVLLSTLAAAIVSRRERFAVDVDDTAVPSRSMRALRRTSLRPSATIGVAMALEPRGGTAWAVRSALLGVAFGVMGVVAVVVFVASVDELVDSPARYGSPFDAFVSGFSGNPLEDGGGDLLEDPRVAKAGLGYGGLGRVGGVEVNTYAFESLKGDMGLTMLDGHRPSGKAEVVLGTATRDAADVGIGDDVEVVGEAGSLEATVVGTAVFPVADERGSPSRGVLMGLDDLERISAPDEIKADVLITWADGVDVDEANSELAAATDTEVFEPRVPSDVNNLWDVRALPRALAGFLAILAALAAVHALVSTVRMRRQELAVLRTLGFERAQLSRTLWWQATTIGVVGLVLGVPLGLLVGRLVWGAVAASIGVVEDPVTPVLAIAAVVVGVLAILSVTALLPGRAARRVAPALALRTA